MDLTVVVSLWLAHSIAEAAQPSWVWSWKKNLSSRAAGKWAFASFLHGWIFMIVTLVPFWIFGLPFWVWLAWGVAHYVLDCTPLARWLEIPLGVYGLNHFPEIVDVADRLPPEGLSLEVALCVSASERLANDIHNVLLGAVMLVALVLV